MLAAACLTAPADRFDKPEPASPALRAAMVHGGFLSEAGLRLIQADMGPGGRAAVRRFYAGITQGYRHRPPGWGAFNLRDVPSLGLAGLTAEDAKRINAAIPPSASPLESGRPFRGADLRSASGRRALYCLTQAIYFEAGRDDEQAQAAVAQVVLNRVRHPAYPGSICGVVYQGAARATGCQFSYTCDGSLKRGIMTSAWGRAEGVAKRALAGFVAREVGTATNYHADYVTPYWAATLVKISQVGPHIFYRWTGPLGRKAALTKRYAGNETNIAREVLASWDERVQGAGGAMALTQANGPRASEAAVRTLEAAGLVAKVKGGRVHALLNPVARKPTTEEVKAINDKLEQYEKGLAPAEPAPAQE